MFAEHPLSGGFTKKEFERAMLRMLGKRIRIETTTGRHSHRKIVAI
jgi:hypothetical protein